MTHPDTMKRLRERTAARLAAGLIPSEYPVPAQAHTAHRTPKVDRGVNMPCKFLGEPLTVDEKKRYGLPLHRTYSVCEHADRPKGEFVCPCTGCGYGRCVGYTKPVETNDDPQDRPEGVGLRGDDVPAAAGQPPAADPGRAP